jgi:hypothetical protein
MQCRCLPVGYIALLARAGEDAEEPADASAARNCTADLLAAPEEPESSASFRAFKVIRLLRLSKMLRLAKLMKLFEKYAEAMSQVAPPHQALHPENARRR